MAMAIAPLLTAAGASAGTAATVGSLLTIGTGALGAMQTISAARTQSSIHKSQAQQYELNSELEKLKGRQEALTIKQQRDQNLASINATFAARGGFSGSGTPFQAQVESRANAADAIDTAMFNSSMQAGQLKSQANNLRIEAKSAKRAGYIDAFTGLAKNNGFGTAIQTLLDV